jgi:hypothetical protein
VSASDLQPGALLVREHEVWVGILAEQGAAPDPQLARPPRFFKQLLGGGATSVTFAQVTQADGKPGWRVMAKCFDPLQRISALTLKLVPCKSIRFGGVGSAYAPRWLDSDACFSYALKGEKWGFQADLSPPAALGSGGFYVLWYQGKGSVPQYGLIPYAHYGAAVPVPASGSGVR